MAPKKEEKKSVDPVEAKFQEEIKQLEQAKNDLQLEHTFVLDKFRQLKAENDRLRTEIDGFKTRLSSAADDYHDILEHRQEQIKAEENKLKGLQSHVEKLEGDIQRYQDEIKGLKDSNGQQAVKLDEAAQMLADKENLEEAVRRQHDLIEKQTEELRNIKKHLEERDTELSKANLAIEELTLKSAGATDLRILFDEPWLVQVSYARLKGDIPLDREFGCIASLALGKHLVLYGGASKVGGAVSEGVGREVAVLNVESGVWERPSSARTLAACHSHSAVVVGRTKLLVFGGVRGDGGPSSDVALLNTDTMKWITPQLKGSERPLPRSGHSSCCIRERVFMFGGVTADGVLLNDVWMYDQDSSQWNHISTFGTVPTPRTGAATTCTDDGRRLYVFGGNDGSRCLNDVHYLDLEKLTWSPVAVHMGQAPEPREAAAAHVTGKYLLISGGCSTMGRSLGDTRALDLYSPRWECLDEGAWANSLMWLKPRGAYTAFFGNRQFTVKPSMHEKLWELQITEWSLPEDIERLRANRRKDNGFSEKLELSDDAVCGVSSLELSWRPPTKNSDRIERYKLMIATGTGVVKDVYQGRENRFRVTGLKSNTEYIMCVKAIYDDGSFLWSESKAYRTLT
ncbi:hypothetical protein HYH03_010803 [Edaphochlamys debaryana]|uniref:Fibronectin type-III domain-containing protein n=1 Tax=Edaphochlamys debaryana TaxID=47281 RepID=A0A836BVP9_9CHLO|nr:hypothetical protein HYH03_010803 [Edaphochlamys debaryana]|eukprot:KAG2490886.1 hypothetical protein HYH03_010803 [Edaphochlamys debaryana]